MAEFTATNVQGFSGRVWEAMDVIASTAENISTGIVVPLWARGLLLTVDVTAGATLLLTPQLRLFDPVTGVDALLFAAAAALTGVEVAHYHIAEDAPAAAGGITESLKQSFAGVVKVQIAVGNANSATYKVGVSFHA